MVIVEANVPANVETITTNWNGLTVPCVSTRATGETLTAFIRRHRIALLSKAAEEPIVPT